MLSAVALCAASLVVPPFMIKPAEKLASTALTRVADGASVDLGAALADTTAKTLLVLGTHAGDFNSVEYAQKLRAALPKLRAKGVERCLFVVNGAASSCAKLAELVDLPADVEVLADPSGEAGRKFGVSRGWQADNDDISPYLKLFVVGLGFGDLGTLPAVLIGYTGNPNGRREWIDSALKQGQLAGRSAGPLPDILELDGSGEIVANKFDDFPLVSGWGVRPLELATLRLQNLLGVQFANWEALKPVDDRLLTQLGGCTVVGPGGTPLFNWLDRGLCDVVDFEEVVEAI